MSALDRAILLAIVARTRPHLLTWEPPPGWEEYTFEDWFGETFPMELLAESWAANDVPRTTVAEAAPQPCRVDLVAGRPGKAKRARRPAAPPRLPPERMATVTPIQQAKARHALLKAGFIPTGGAR